MDAPTEWTYGGLIDWSSPAKLKLLPVQLPLRCVIEALRERYFALGSLGSGLDLPRLRDSIRACGGVATAPGVVRTYQRDYLLPVGSRATATWAGGRRQGCVVSSSGSGEMRLQDGVGDAFPSGGEIKVSAEFNPLRAVKVYAEDIAAGIDEILRYGNIFLQHTDRGGDWSGAPENYSFPCWTEAAMLSAIGASSRLPLPCLSVSLGEWLIQQYKLVNLLRWTRVWYDAVSIPRLLKSGDGGSDNSYSEAYSRAVSAWQTAADVGWSEVVALRSRIAPNNWSPLYTARVDTASWAFSWRFGVETGFDYRSCKVDTYAYAPAYVDSGGGLTAGQYNKLHSDISLNSDGELHPSGSYTNLAYHYAGTPYRAFIPPHPEPPPSIGEYITTLRDSATRVVCKFDVPGGFKFVE